MLGMHFSEVLLYSELLSFMLTVHWHFWFDVWSAWHAACIFFYKLFGRLHLSGIPV